MLGGRTGAPKAVPALVIVLRGGVWFAVNFGRLPESEVRRHGTVKNVFSMNQKESDHANRYSEYV